MFLAEDLQFFVTFDRKPQPYCEKLIARNFDIEPFCSVDFIIYPSHCYVECAKKKTSNYIAGG